MRDIQKDYGRFGLNWGYANSPLLLDGDLIVPVLHGMKTDDPSYLLRIDGKTGQTKWKVERPNKAIRESPDAYTTPALVRVGNAREIVITGADVVTGHDPATGKELWRADGLNPQNNPAYRIVASPVVHQDIVIAPTRERPMLALQRRRPRRRHDVAQAVGVRQRARRADAGHRRHVCLRHHRSRRRLLPGPGDRQDRLRARSGWSRAPTARRRCSPTARSTSRARTACSASSAPARSSSCWRPTGWTTTRSALSRCPGAGCTCGRPAGCGPSVGESRPLTIDDWRSGDLSGD